ncbi:MAG TPA: FISUMP domain-containing protein, partial [Prolixibacteraceae bacterium]|nr:FISUMP domain-containing protein [Prolixibacteraceae bacterium]
VRTFTQEFSYYFYAMRRMQAQQRMNYGDGAVLIRNSMPVPVKVSIISSKLKYPTFGNFNQQNATAYLFAAGQTGTRNEISWKLPQGSYTLCFEWTDGHYMNPGTKTYYSTQNINLTRPWTPNLNHEANIDFYSNGETGNCGGKQWEFLPPKDDHKYGTLTDRRDNNTYKTINIGKQTWMAENLKYIPAVSPANDGWYGEKYYYVYGYNGTNVKEAIKTENYKKYGVLYNWDAAMDGEEGSEENPSQVQGVCPKGWHLPSTQEWKELVEYLAVNKFAYENSENSYQIAKALASTTHWEKNNTEEYGAVAYDLTKNNKSGFSALPAGYFFMNHFAGSFDDIGFVGRWWTSTNYDGSNEWAYNYYMHSTSKELYEYIDFMYLGFSVRCVKD